MPARFRGDTGSAPPAPGGPNAKAEVKPSLALSTVIAGTSDKPVIGSALAFDAGRATLLTRMSPGVALSTVNSGDPAKPLAVPGPKLSSILNVGGASHRQSPGVNLAQVAYDLTHRRGGSTVVTSTGWTSPANAIDGTNGRSNGTNAQSPGSVGGNTNTLVLSYPVQPSRTDLTISLVRLHFYWAQSATFVASSFTFAYSLNGGGAYTNLAAPSPSPTAYDITVAVGGDWAKIAALRTRVIAIHNAGSAVENFNIDAIEVEVVASRTDLI